MARLSGVDLPNKRIEYALTYIYGIGLTYSRAILKVVNISVDKRANDLNEEELAKLRQEIQKHYVVEGDLRKQTAMNIKTLMDIGSYRGIRHRKGLPCRGQKTKTNARTRKGKKQTVSAAAAK